MKYIPKAAKRNRCDLASFIQVNGLDFFPTGCEEPSVLGDYVLVETGSRPHFGNKVGKGKFKTKTYTDEADFIREFEICPYRGYRKKSRD